MADRTIRLERLPRVDPRLGRHVHHDSLSRLYPVRAAERVVLTDVQHVRHVPVFDQGQLGDCVANAGVGCMGTGLFHATVGAWPYSFDNPGIQQAYRDVTRADPYAGAWEPDDTGSDGLSMAKVFKAAGVIAGFEHAFSLDQALAALMQRPFITGVAWTRDMFTPDAEGIVHPTGSDAGGHEFVGDGYDVKRGLVWFTNSWGTGWGNRGRFAMPAEEYANLLSRDGDVTVFVPVTEPAPTPPADPDQTLAAAVGKWARRDAICGRKQRAAVRAWLDAKGL